MMKKLITVLFAIGVSASTVAQDQPMALPINMPCMSPDKANEMMKKYNEVPFAQADGIIISMVNNEFYNTNLKIYLSESGGFTITSQIDPNVICMMTTGTEFKPILNGEGI